MPKKLTQAEFLAKAVAAHGVGRYDYSQAVYVGGSAKVKILCPTHGLFEQTANSHMMGTGCPGCAGVARPSTAQFVERARQLHGNRYDYSKSIYISSGEKVIIICPQHGQFEQAASMHLSGQGCRACAGTVPLTTESFILRAKKKFGDKFDYSKAKYHNKSTKIIIGCSQHGFFEQTPENHLLGYGCKLCGLANSAKSHAYDTEKFIAKANETHENRYDYSHSVYVNSKSKVAIYCPKHGLFKQLPAIHIYGAGCPGCSSLRTAESHMYNQAKFIELAKRVHGENTYDYSATIYTAAKNKLAIICKQHGLFEQLAGGHLMGRGCRKCGTEKGVLDRSHDTQVFISLSQAAHGVGAYDYSAVVYKRGKDKVIIICPQHGQFEQVAYTHMTGHGCPSCAKASLNELQRLSWVERASGRLCTLYFIRLYKGQEEFYKIGVTFHSVEVRYKSLVDLAGYEFEILAQHTSVNAARIWEWEQSIINTFAHLRYNPKHRFGGETECFSSADEILSIFPL